MAVIGVIGYGFVGAAVVAGFINKQNKVVVADPKLSKTTQDVLKEQPDVVFICVPTPMGADGVANTSIVETVVQELHDYTGIVVLKSTVVPTVVQRLEKMHPRFVYNPEFLTEANAVRDFLNPSFHVFGGNGNDTRYLDYLYYNYSNCVPTDNINFVTAVEAALIKYSVNSFMATKVMFMNQLYDLCNSLGADYRSVADAMGDDPRITHSHMMVPGPDGRRAASGPCFGKDIPAIIRESQALGCELTIIKEAWNRNCDIRNSYPERLPREIEQHISFNKIV